MGNPFALSMEVILVWLWFLLNQIKTIVPIGFSGIIELANNLTDGGNIDESGRTLAGAILAVSMVGAAYSRANLKPDVVRIKRRAANAIPQIWSAVGLNQMPTCRKAAVLAVLAKLG